jgi:hypothetical protein
MAQNPDDQNPVTIVVAFILIVVATTALLHVSGTIHVPGF